MIRRLVTLSALVITIPLVLGACGLAEPYIYQSNEYNRERKDFGKAPTDRKSVSICYNKRSATPSEVRNLAESECAAYGKKAVFLSHDFLTCPLITPARALFRCVTEDDANGTKANVGLSP